MEKFTRWEEQNIWEFLDEWLDFFQGAVNGADRDAEAAIEFLLEQARTLVWRLELERQSRRYG